MKANLVRRVGLVLTLAMIPVVVEAQRAGKPDDPQQGTNSCAAGGIRCWFGSAAPCAVSCTIGTPVCEGARCILGFPVASHCYCDITGLG
jgi:hypothetical protein